MGPQHQHPLTQHSTTTVRWAGVDEAGRGSLAGPVVAAACILPSDFSTTYLRDSKQLSPDQRERLFAQLTHHAGVVYGIGVVASTVIDEINILQASMQAMEIAIAHLSQVPERLLVDGNRCPKTWIPCQPIVRGDTLEPLIMAASILAKVTRDRIMTTLHDQWPEYGFNRNKGYGTSHHLEALARFGVCQEHRRSYAPVRAVGLRG